MNTHLYANGVPITLPDGTEFPFWQDETEYRRSQPAGVIGPVPSKRLASDRLPKLTRYPPMSGAPGSRQSSSENRTDSQRTSRAQDVLPAMVPTRKTVHQRTNSGIVLPAAIGPIDAGRALIPRAIVSV